VYVDTGMTKHRTEHIRPKFRSEMLKSQKQYCMPVKDCKLFSMSILWEPPSRRNCQVYAAPCNIAQYIQHTLKTLSRKNKNVSVWTRVLCVMTVYLSLVTWAYYYSVFIKYN